MNIDRTLYNALAYLVTIVRQVRDEIDNPLMTQRNLEDLDNALKKSESLLFRTAFKISK